MFMTYSSVKKWIYYNDEKKYLELTANFKNNEVIIFYDVINFFILNVNFKRM